MVGLIGSDLWIGEEEEKSFHLLASAIILKAVGLRQRGTPVCVVHFLHPSGPTMSVIEGQVCGRIVKES